MRFFVLAYHKTHFPCLYCLKKKDGKMANFSAKPWVNPFGKMSIFLTFCTSCFYCLEMRYFFLEYHKTEFPCLYCLKKKMEKWQIFEQNHGLTRLEKCQFFFLTSCFYCLKIRFIVLEYHKTYFPGLYCLKKKRWKNEHF